MIAGLTVLAIIPARGGSKGVPRKALRNVAGQTLLAWTIEQAQKSKYIDRIILSSEDSEIIDVAKKLNCEVPFVRPAELSRDDSPGMDPILHAVNALPAYDITLELQVTSPLRTTLDIDQALELMVEKKSPAIISVSPVDKSPFWMMEVDQAHHMKMLIENKFTRRQDQPEVFAFNGAIYAAKTDWLKVRKTFFSHETIAFKMPRERALDIDTEFDLQVANALVISR